MVNRLGVVIAVVALAGCGSGAAKKLIPHASCSVPSGGYCLDMNGLAGANLTDFQSACTGGGGTNSSAACPTASLMGYCTVATGLPGIDEIMRFYSPTWNPYAAEVECSGQGGTYKDLLPHFSCDQPANGVCQELSGLTGTDLSNFQAGCTAAPGTSSTAACPSTNRVGTCVYPEPTPGNSNVIRFYAPGWGASSAQAECTRILGGLAGIFVPG
jgi:hypothetical protein